MVEQNRNRPFEVTDEVGYTNLVPANKLDETLEIAGLSRFLTSIRADRKPLLQCPLCQTTVQEAIKAGLLGCGLCYSTIFPSVRAAHSTTQND